MDTLLDKLIDKSVHCVKCGAKMEECDCWEKCSCGWTKEKGKFCNNPIHDVKPILIISS